MKLLSCITIILPIAVYGFSSPFGIDMNKASVDSQRRNLLATFPAAFVAPTLANALDMDAFMNSELENDSKNCDPKLNKKCAPQLTADEAMCKYGQR